MAHHDVAPQLFRQTCKAQVLELDLREGQVGAGKRRRGEGIGVDGSTAKAQVLELDAPFGKALAHEIRAEFVEGDAEPLRRTDPQAGEHELQAPEVDVSPSHRRRNPARGEHLGHHEVKRDGQCGIGEQGENEERQEDAAKNTAESGAGGRRTSPWGRTSGRKGSRHVSGSPRALTLIEQSRTNPTTVEGRCGGMRCRGSGMRPWRQVR